jgi:ATP-binding cassette, sub-family E, member 1
MESLSYNISDYDNLDKEIFSEISFPFPFIKSSLDECNMIFTNFCPKIGTLTVLFGKQNIGKSYYLQVISGLEKPTHSQEDGDKLYLKYDISYKPENISPKFNGTVLELLSKIVKNDDELYHELEEAVLLSEFIYNNVQDLNIEEIERLSFLLTLLQDKTIFIFDCPVRKVQPLTRYRLWKYFKNFVSKYHKIGIIVEDNIEFIRQFGDSVYLFENCADDDGEDLVVTKEYTLKQFLNLDLICNKS